MIGKAIKSARGHGHSHKFNNYVSHKIEILRKEGYGQKQSVAIAISMARKRGYK